jgi:geranylgeranylglycerol-phosphate geranylgeranyltransferase
MPGPRQLWVAAVVAGALTAAGNVINDYFDIDVDRINKPTRVLPSNSLSQRAAAMLAALLMAVALFMSLLLGAAMAAIAVAVALVSYVYSWKLKRFFLLGNALVSVLTALTFFYGGLAVNNVQPAWIPALIVLVFMFGREVLKTAEDYDGDLRVGARTIAIVWGKTNALRLFALLAVLVILLIPLPWLSGQVSVIYMLLALPGVDAALLLVSLMVLIRPMHSSIKKALTITKGSWVLWALAMFLGVGFRI